MQPIEFPQHTDVLAKDQPQYIPLPVHVKYEQHEDAEGRPVNVPMEMTACFELSPEEIAEINATTRLWYTQCVYGNPFQPVRLSTQNPFEEAPKRFASPIDALVKALNNDPDYRETWKANIAMAFYDAYFAKDYQPNEEVRQSLADIANKAAVNFLNTLCTKLDQAICKA